MAATWTRSTIAEIVAVDLAAKKRFVEMAINLSVVLLALIECAQSENAAMHPQECFEAADPGHAVAFAIKKAAPCSYTAH